MGWGVWIRVLPPRWICVMKVVDRDCRVVETGRLRIMDASVTRLPLRAHYQATVDVLAENTTDSICTIFCVGVIIVHV